MLPNYHPGNSDPKEARWDRHVFDKTQEQKRQISAARGGSSRKPRWAERERERREREKQKAALRRRARAVPKDGPSGRGEDPRFQVLGFFLEQKEDPDAYTPEVFTTDELPEMIERAGDLPGTTLVQMDLCDPDTGDRTSRLLCEITGNYVFKSNQ